MSESTMMTSLMVGKDADEGSSNSFKPPEQIEDLNDGVATMAISKESQLDLAVCESTARLESAVSQTMLRQPQYQIPLTPGYSPASRTTGLAARDKLVDQRSGLVMPAFVGQDSSMMHESETNLRQSTASRTVDSIKKRFSAIGRETKSSPVQEPQPPRPEPRWMALCRAHDTMLDLPEDCDDTLERLDAKARHPQPENITERVKTELSRITKLMQMDFADEYDVAHYIVLSYAVFGFFPESIPPSRPDDFHVLEPPTLPLGFMYFAMDKILDIDLLAIAVTTFEEISFQKTCQSTVMVILKYYHKLVGPQGCDNPA